ncbi:MAG: hypothetical protein QY314_04280 [Candidatus Dojkabacteria bacterium]|nr:MAG: hypothetical protein QY314_04280 [Candidatus Dojkabacteria bacterium]
MIPLPKLSNPALQAFELVGIRYLEDLQKFSQKEILALHGVGPKTIRMLAPAMKAHNIAFKK